MFFIMKYLLFMETQEKKFEKNKYFCLNMNK